MSKFKFDVDRQDFYEHGCSDEKKQRTRKRLVQLAKLGFKEVGVAEFGIPGVVSGIYIESVWFQDNHKWNDKIAWMKKEFSLSEIK